MSKKSKNHKRSVSYSVNSLECPEPFGAFSGPPDLEGDTIAYRTGNGKMQILKVTYNVELGAKVSRKALRLFRLKQSEKGRRASVYDDNSLASDILVLVGPGASANRVVHWLDRISKEIKKCGLVIGENGEGEPAYETVDPQKKLRKRRVMNKRQRYYAQI